MGKYTEKWIMIRVRVSTRDRLRRIKSRFESEANASRPIGTIHLDRFGLSVDSLIVELARRDEAHAARGKKARAKGKRTAKAE